MVEAQRAHTKMESLKTENIELSAELDVLRERLDVMDALGKFRPEELASVSATNAALAESIQALLPKLEKTAATKAAAKAPAAPAPPSGSHLEIQSV